jgi:histone demethylase JARID1
MQNEVPPPNFSEPLLPRLSRRTPIKAQTPRSGPSSSSHLRTAANDTRKIKQTFTTCKDYPAALPIFHQPFEPTADLPRNQRRSKVEALTKIDRANTPNQVNGGSVGTSFLPARAPSAGPSGPHPSRNPLLRPPTVNPPFDPSTVRFTAPRYAPSRAGTRLFGLEECPVFTPTLDEFSDPLAYIDSIGAIAKPYGMCKIIPPEGWQMPFSLETDTFKFKTRLQKLNRLEAASRAKRNYLEQLTMFHLQQGDAKVTIPVIDRKTLDVWALRKEVNKLGGHEEVSKLKGWTVIAEKLGYHVDHALHIKSAYLRIIYPFETFALRAKSTSGSPLTPMPSTTASRPPGFVNESPSSPTRHVGRMGGMRTSPKQQTDGEAISTLSPPFAISSMAAGPSLLQSASALEEAAKIADLPKIKVPGFSSMDGSESELSDDEAMSLKYRRRSTPEPPVYQKGEVCDRQYTR